MLAIALGLTCLLPVLALAANVRMILALRRLPELRPPPPERWPRLSVVIPACNEADTIEPALATLRALRYPELELVLIDDRSTDATGAIMDRVAADDPRFRVLHNTALPEGWLGKVHALELGTRASTGEIVLFTDADVAFAPDALERTVALLEAERLDHLCVIPDLQSRSFVASMVIASAMRSIALSQRPWNAADPARKEAIGSGAFNMVRRAAFDRTEGFDWLRLEVADDIGLGLLMKRSGARSSVVLGAGSVKVEWYPSFRAAVRGMEKNGWAQLARFSVARGIALALVYLFVTVGPFLALGGPQWLSIAGAIAISALIVSTVLISRWTGHALLPMLLSAPFGDLLMVYVVIRATILGARRGGLVWRGTVYPNALLASGMRVKF